MRKGGCGRQMVVETPLNLERGLKLGRKSMIYLYGVGRAWHGMRRQMMVQTPLAAGG